MRFAVNTEVSNLCDVVSDWRSSAMRSMVFAALGLAAGIVLAQAASAESVQPRPQDPAPTPPQSSPEDGLPCRKLRSDTDSRRRGICLPMSCAGRNWASRPQQSRGSFNRRAFAATANLAVNRGLIADLVQSERPVSLPPPNAPSTSRRQDRRSRWGCHPGKRRSSELAIALSTVARGESLGDRAIGIGQPLY